MNWNKKFNKEINEPGNSNDPSYWFIFRDNDLLVYSEENDQCSIPLAQTPQELGINPLSSQYLGRYDGICCYSAEAPPKTKPPVNMFFQHPWSLYNFMAPDFFRITGYGFQIMKWDQTYQYCGRCGSKTKNLENERAKICDRCHLTSYPRISPAVIMAVIKDNTLLLAKSGRFKRDMYSVLAGFVDAGETLEECVQREVKEEVNIEVENIRYFGSQPWPFPDSLMVGFIADYKSGEIACDCKEIITAAWFRPDNLPNIPGKMSIAREIIDWFVEEFS